MSKYTKYCVTLANNQGWVTKNEFDRILLNLSKKYREHLYVLNEFENEYHSGEEYVFVHWEGKDSEYMCNQISEELKENNISAFVRDYDEEVLSFTGPIPVFFYNQIIYPTKEEYEDFGPINDDDIDDSDIEDDEEMDFFDNAILINNNQPWVTRQQFEKILLKISKIDRCTIYRKFEFEEFIIENGEEYVFLSADDKESLYETYEELKSRNIVCRIEENYTKQRIPDYNRIIKFSDTIIRAEDDFRENLVVINEPIESSEISNKKNNGINENYLSFEKMHQFDDFFKNKIIGQNQVIEKIKRQLITKLYDFNDANNNRPAGIFFFVGPTGVGKTEVCKQLSEFLYNNREINRLDMSEYKSDVAIQKLIGAPNGYVGYEEGGILINKLEKNPNAILLFDEIEKADKSVFDLFLQMFDEGIITSNKGKKFILKNTFIILTSNIGAANIESNHSYDEICSEIKEEINDFFVYELNRPEILGRIGKENIIVFNTISKQEDQYKILDIYFKQFIKNFKKNNVILNFDKNNTYNNILKNVDITKGARDIRNQFDEFKQQFSLSLFNKKLHINYLKNQTIMFKYFDNKVEIQINKRGKE